MEKNLNKKYMYKHAYVYIIKSLCYTSETNTNIVTQLYF